MSRRVKRRGKATAVVGSVTVSADSVPAEPMSHAGEESRDNGSSQDATVASVECVRCGVVVGRYVSPDKVYATEHRCEDGARSLPSSAVAAMLVEEFMPGVACQRERRHDSTGWTCACGGRGPVGRSPDGIPYVTDEMLAHSPGQQK